MEPLGLVPDFRHFVILSAILFAIGLYGLLTRRNAIGILMGVELMLNAAALQFVAFAHFTTTKPVEAAIMALFVIAIAAAETVIAMAIFVALFRARKSIDVTRIDEMRY